MSNPVTRTRKARREDLIEATIRLIFRDGIEAASLARIAAEAGTSKGTALYHFANKEELYESVMNSLFEAGGVYMSERIVAAADTPRSKIEAYFESNLRFIVENLEHVVATQRIVQKTGVVELDGAIAPLRSMLIAGQQDGSFEQFDADYVAHSIRSLIDAAAYYLPGHPQMDSQRFIDEGVGLLLRTIGASPISGIPLQRD
ncbi:TetR/AcrR family transcriptional regulator [Arthrobacter sp. MYb227]|uniref:TetR/AcrR family transcriptional regulator n=1 Tax=Arthrobacter sp. MYb227 TaxID=1848601 RepID=UPI0015E276CB|nr:TetR/AcrR family transcriptional regulator [Arthrobacter sp. MYb227]